MNQALSVARSGDGENEPLRVWWCREILAVATLMVVKTSERGGGGISKSQARASTIGDVDEIKHTRLPLAIGDIGGVMVGCSRLCDISSLRGGLVAADSDELELTNQANPQVLWHGCGIRVNCSGTYFAEQECGMTGALAGGQGVDVLVVWGEVDSCLQIICRERGV
ncbi:hypothetical protein BD779DRAFT_1791709 [Infundibulicybe gibba]|nr:hypothetical protein BD779DRAFT_1791709 [Infundibulicybe gibba]